MLGKDSSFLYSEGFFLYTTWTQSKMTNRVQYHEKTHKIHRSDRIQTCISQKLGLLKIWKLCQNVGTDSSFMYREGFFLYTTGTQSKMTNRAQYHEKTHKIRRSDSIQTYISQKLGLLKIWKLCQNVGTDSIFMYSEGFFLYTTGTQSKMTNRAQYHEKTHKIHHSDRLQTCISQKLGMLEIWKLCQNVGKGFIFLV